MRYDVIMKDEHKNTVVSITGGTIVKAILILLGLGALWTLRDLVLVVVTSVILASAIEPGIRFLSRFKIHRIVAVLMIYVSLIGLFLGLVYGFVPPIVNEAADISQKLPSIVHTIDRSLFGANGIFVPILSQGGTATGTVSPLFEQLFNKVSSFGSAQNTMGSVSIVLSGLFSFILIIVLSFYFAMQEHGIQNFLRIVIPGRERETYAIDLWERSKEKIGKWMQGQLLLAVLMFVLVYLGLTIFGVPYALSLALLAGLLETIPVFGPILSAVPAVILAFTTGGTTLAMIIAGFYLLVQQFESHLIYPLVVRKIVGVPPILVILALIVGWELAGVLGVLISVPIAAVLMEVVEDIEKKKNLLA